ncbi:patatin-like phospholipase family protein [Olsenella sp. YH-ols2221]|uniref:patatin-like phospholipase family protein n=1 Tax=Olsenella kribbiana TaxID=3115221 RepID=UPI002ED94DA6
MARIQGVGVAFCGGGFRSFAEVAAIEDMERNNIEIGAVAGTSMGALVAALAGIGIDSRRMEELLVMMDQKIVDEGVLKMNPIKLFNAVGTHGIIDSAIMERFARNILDEAGIYTFADFKKPVALCAVDVVTGELCVFTNDPELFHDENGNWRILSDEKLEVAKCVTCSASYPLVVTPTAYIGRTFMDGGCRMNLPTPLFDRSMVDAVVGVGMIRHARPIPDMTPLSIAKKTMNCGANQLDRIYSQAADIYINLPVSGDDAFQAGTGEQVIAEARQMIEEHPIDWSAARPSALTAVRRAAVDAFLRMVRQHAVE